MSKCSLRNKSKTIFLLLTFIGLTVINERRLQSSIEDPYYPQIKATLAMCLFDTNNKNSFESFVNHLIKILKNYTIFLDGHMHRSHIVEQNGGINKDIINAFIQDLNRIKNSRNILQIGSVLAKYNKFMPGLLQGKTIQQLAVGLRFRLAQRGNAPLPEPSYVKNNQ